MKWQSVRRYPSALIQGLVLWSCVTAAALLAPGCAAPPSGGVPRSAYIPPQTSVPFQHIGRVPLVEVTVNDRGPYLFMVDTGAGSCAISDRVALDLKLPPSKNIRAPIIFGAGGAGATEYRWVSSLQLGQAVFNDLDVVVHNLRTLQAEGRPLDGIIGLQLFRSALLTIDYPRQRIEIDPGGSLSPNDPEVIPTDTATGLGLTVPLTLGTHKIKAILDTGSSLGLVLGPSAAQKVAFDLGPVHAGWGGSPTGAFRLVLGRLAVDAHLNGHTISRPVVALLPRIEMIGPDDSVQRALDVTLVGGGLLENFTVSVDQRHNLIRLSRTGTDPIQMSAAPLLGIDFDGGG